MIKFFLKWALRLFLLVVLLIVIAIFSINPVARVMMEHNIRAQTGMDAEIGRVSIGIIEPYVEIRDLKLYNPPSYGGTPFLDIPEIHVEYDRAAIAVSKLHLTLVRFNLGELDIVKNEKGETNVFSLGVGLPLPPTNARQAEQAKNVDLGQFKKQTGLTFESIDALNISIGTLKYIDLKDQRHNRTQKIGIDNFVVHNVKSPADLLGLGVLFALRSGDFFTSLMGQPVTPSAPGVLNLLF